ncbi:MAG: response regulator [Spirochaetia bacterium]|nr:response regulator [Spirochaetia bacterium]
MKTVLIADDSATSRLVIKSCVEMALPGTFRFVEAGNGLEAFEKLGGERISLVLTDLRMPQMDGEALLVKMKASENHRHIPVVVITSALHGDLAQRLQLAGAAACLAKPVSPMKIRETLQVGALV